MVHGNILVTEDQQAIINDIIEVRTGVCLLKTLTKIVINSKEGSVNKSVFLEINDSFLVRIKIWKFLAKRSVFMPVAKDRFDRSSQKTT